MKKNFSIALAIIFAVQFSPIESIHADRNYRRTTVDNQRDLVSSRLKNSPAPEIRAKIKDPKDEQFRQSINNAWQSFVMTSLFSSFGLYSIGVSTWKYLQQGYILGPAMNLFFYMNRFSRLDILRIVVNEALLYNSFGPAASIVLSEAITLPVNIWQLNKQYSQQNDSNENEIKKITSNLLSKPPSKTNNIQPTIKTTIKKNTTQPTIKTTIKKK